MTSEPRGPEGPKEPLAPLPGAFALIGLGTSIAACVALGLLLGLVVDRMLQSSPICLIVGIVLGSVVAALSAIAQIRRFT
ncbi:MAG: AtpZ/AtpI family protein [Actinobacteria bacterium]|nr:AtpZ/AtpI family protein [Actinomycetota bacterium]